MKMEKEMSRAFPSYPPAGVQKPAGHELNAAKQRRVSALQERRERQMGTFFHLVIRSVRRRRKEMRLVSVSVFITVFFLSSVTVFQNVMNRYVMEKNYQNYGEWILSEVDDPRNPETKFREMEHPYLSGSGICRTGGAIVDSDGEESDKYIGTADEEWAEIGNVEMYEGHMPEADNEIVMDLPSLAALGYSYDLGQSISVKTVIWPVVEEGDVEGTEESEFAEPQYFQKDFILTGTIRSIAENWSVCESYYLPSCFVTENALSSMGGRLYDTHFYQLDRQYEDIDVKEFALVMSERYDLCNHNSYVYENTIWGSAQMFTAVKVILVVIAGLAAAYLLTSYESGRRRWYYQYRTIGAERSQIREMIFLEGTLAVFPPAAAAFLLPQAGGALICLAVSRMLGVPFFYELHLAEILMQAGMVAGVMLLAVLSAWAGSGDRTLARNTQEITEKQRKRLRKCIGKYEKNLPAGFLARQRKLHPWRQTALILFAVLVCAVCVVTVNQVYAFVDEYFNIREMLDDFSAQKKTEFVYEWKLPEGGKVTSSNSFYDMYDGIDPGMPAEVEGLIGIDHLQMGICDERHTLEWQNMEESPIIQDIMKGSDGNWRYDQLELFRFYENYEEAAEQLKFQVDDEGFDQAAFDRGEQIILVTGSYFPSAYISEGGMRETGIICGQQVEIGSRDTDGKTSVTVGAIIKDPENGSGKMSWDFGNRPYGIIGSVKLAERIAQTDGGKDIMENSVAILLNRQASYEATDKQLASLFQKNGLEYGSYRDYVNGVWNRMVRDVCIYGIFGIVVAAVFLVLLLNFRKNQSFYMDRDYRLLRRMGMERQYFCRLLRSDTRKQALWLLAGAPLAYAEILVVFYMKTLADAEWDIQQGQYGVSFSTILNAYTDNPFWWALELTGRNTAWYGHCGPVT